ncbi:MAG: hypothetical protein B0W54_08465 [Cellvibrio sp. 79]|nr:MAG: hypothetical protein B0W54_08465 [Cellvibrio sp. 79]
MLMSFALAYCTCVLLCIAMNRHGAQIFPARKLPPKLPKIIASGGWLLLLITAALCIKQQGVGTGLAVLAGIFTAAIFVLALLLNYAARWIPAVGAVMLATGIIF